MQVAVSVAVILLALSITMTDAVLSDSEPITSFEKFQKDVEQFVDQVEEKTKAAFHNIQNSEFSNKTRNWFTDQFEKLKAKWREAFPDQGSN